MVAWPACVEIGAAVCDAIGTGIPREHRVDSLGFMAQAFETLLLVPVPQHTVGHALGAFVVLYEHDASKLDRAAERLVSVIASSHSAARHRARARLSVVLRRVGATYTDSISRYASPLGECTLRAHDSAEFSTVDKIHFLDASLTAILALQKFSDRQALVEAVFQPVLDVLKRRTGTNALVSPIVLYKYLSEASAQDPVRDIDVSPLTAPSVTLETSAHLIVRPVAKSSGPLPLPGLHSRTIAPHSVTVSSALITSRHGLYNRDKCDVRQHVALLRPASREIAHLLNLEGLHTTNPAPADMRKRESGRNWKSGMPVRAALRGYLARPRHRTTT